MKRKQLPKTVEVDRETLLKLVRSLTSMASEATYAKETDSYFCKRSDITYFCDNVTGTCKWVAETLEKKLKDEGS